jgi:hypothetical protein
MWVPLWATLTILTNVRQIKPIILKCSRVRKKEKYPLANVIGVCAK